MDCLVVRIKRLVSHSDIDASWTVANSLKGMTAFANKEKPQWSHE
jgi:hypothetical protein